MLVGKNYVKYKKRLIYLIIQVSRIKDLIIK